jgi:hypothetical protein
MNDLKRLTYDTALKHTTVISTIPGGLAERLRQQFAKLSLGNRWVGSIPTLSARTIAG